MSEKRFQKTRIVDKWGGIYDSKTDRVLDVNDVEHKLNEQQATIENLRKWIKAEQKQVVKRDAFIKQKGLMSEFVKELEDE